MSKDKERIVDLILKNQTYMPDSGMVLRLRKQLLKLSVNDLINLKLLIEIKCSTAATIAANVALLTTRPR